MPEGSEGLLDGSKGLPMGSEGLAMGGDLQTYGRMYVLTEFFPILQDFVPCWGRCQKKEVQWAKREYKTPKGIIRLAVSLLCFSDAVKMPKMAGQRPH